MFNLIESLWLIWDFRVLIRALYRDCSLILTFAQFKTCNKQKVISNIELKFIFYIFDILYFYKFINIY